MSTLLPHTTIPFFFPPLPILHSSLSAYASILETGPVPPLFISQRQHARRIRVLCISREYEPGQRGDLQKVPTSSRPYIGQFSWRQPIAGNASFASCQAAPSPPQSLVRSFVRSCWTPEKVRTARTVCDSRVPPPRSSPSAPGNQQPALSSYSLPSAQTRGFPVCYHTTYLSLHLLALLMPCSTFPSPHPSIVTFPSLLLLSMAIETTPRRL